MNTAHRLRTGRLIVGTLGAVAAGILIVSLDPGIVTVPVGAVVLVNGLAAAGAWAREPELRAELRHQRTALEAARDAYRRLTAYNAGLERRVANLEEERGQ